MLSKTEERAINKMYLKNKVVSPESDNMETMVHAIQNKIPGRKGPFSVISYYYNLHLKRFNYNFLISSSFSCHEISIPKVQQGLESPPPSEQNELIFHRRIK